MAVRLITGCGSGFGEAIALAFADRNDSVVASMRSPDRSPSSLRGRSNVDIITLDITDAASRRHALEQTLSRHGRLDTLVNNAGAVSRGSIEDTAEDVSRLIFETNYFGPVELMRSVLPIMRQQGGGRIVTVTAIGAILSTPLLGVYCASKQAMDSAAATVDLEGRPFGVRAPCVLPGQFRTAIFNSPAEPITEPYRDIAETLDNVRKAHAADVLSDLTPVVDAVLTAATDAEPKPRYLAGVGLVEEIVPAVHELERLQAFWAERCGVA